MNEYYKKKYLKYKMKYLMLEKQAGGVYNSFEKIKSLGSSFVTKVVNAASSYTGYDDYKAVMNQEKERQEAEKIEAEKKKDDEKKDDEKKAKAEEARKKYALEEEKRITEEKKKEKERLKNAKENAKEKAIGTFNGSKDKYKSDKYTKNTRKLFVEISTFGDINQTEYEQLCTISEKFKQYYELNTSYNTKKMYSAIKNNYTEIYNLILEKFSGLGQSISLGLGYLKNDDNLKEFFSNENILKKIIYLPIITENYSGGTGCFNRSESTYEQEKEYFISNHKHVGDNQDNYGYECTYELGDTILEYVIKQRYLITKK